MKCEFYYVFFTMGVKRRKIFGETITRNDGGGGDDQKAARKLRLGKYLLKIIFLKISIRRHVPFLSA